jgi:hypothetical protein
MLTFRSVIATAGARLFYLKRAATSSDRTLEATYYVVCTELHLGCMFLHPLDTIVDHILITLLPLDAIMASAITSLGPFLRPFSRSFNTSYRRSSYAQPSVNSGIGSRNHVPPSGSYQMGPLQARKISMITLDGRQKSILSGGHGTPTAESPVLGAAQGGALPSPSGLSLRPEVYRRDTAVHGGAGGEGDEEDVASRVSDDSRRMIITKRTELTVEMDRRSAVSDSEWKTRVEGA